MRLRVVVLVVGLLVVGACGGDDEGRPAAGGEGTVVEVPALDGPSVPDALATGEEELVEMLREPVLDALGAEAESGRARLEELDGQRRQDAAAAIAVLAPAGGGSGKGIDLPDPGQLAAFGSLTVAGAAVGAMGDRVPEGPPGSIVGGSGVAIGRTGSRIVVEVDDTRTVEVAPGITYQERFQGTIGVDLCPDAEGVVEVTVDVRGEGTATVDGVAVSSQVTVSGTVTARVDESAQVADTTFDLTTGYASQGGVDASGKPPPSSFTEVHTTATVASGGSTEGDATVVRSSSQADPSRAMQVTQSAIDVVAELVRQALGKAESVWQNGGCVSLEVLEAPGRVEPGSEHPVNAEVHHVFEGKDLDLPVRATLGAGGESVSPGEARGIPARFTYVAPSEDGARATLVLETRSRRGADRETIEIEVGGGWRAEGGGDGITITGTIGDLAAPFQLQGQFEGGSATLSYSPAGEEGGTFTYQGGGSGVTVSGSGTYTVTENPDGTRTISGTADGCVKGISGSCRTTHNVITLYPE